MGGASEQNPRQIITKSALGVVAKTCAIRAWALKTANGTEPVAYLSKNELIATIDTKRKKVDGYQKKAKRARRPDLGRNSLTVNRRKNTLPLIEIISGTLAH